MIAVRQGKSDTLPAQIKPTSARMATGGQITAPRTLEVARWLSSSLDVSSLRTRYALKLITLCVSVLILIPVSRGC
ncbi:hypothetical protein GCM10011499_33270 [Pelagibacterium lentulum]|uniref:Uncharacterized protein n=1 Tax=Pelagibacterium lentulum TaxID=2029865 RepID=A0A916RK53_9HYPH|nr:hypothetical protein GCM10011499_33270 [Pelagibacterium lentulum]